GGLLVFFLAWPKHAGSTGFSWWWVCGGGEGVVVWELHSGREHLVCTHFSSFGGWVRVAISLISKKPFMVFLDIDIKLIA
ncbi:hypothetical protein, partial [Zhihengliuella halotolerans]|uniref:hypothetical protein n=1 Tax=Zhihengliuella halotolerans TaxID=370736 RepID=UPI001CA5C91D